MHSRVELNVHRIVRNAEFLGFTNYLTALLEAEHFRLKSVGEHCLIIHHTRIKHHNRHSDSSLSQPYAFVVHCHGKISRTSILKSLGKLVGTSAIARSFHHAHYARGGGY